MADSSPPPSLLRRLRSKASLLVLRSPRQPLTDFHVEVNDPHRVYAPTDCVAGFVCITVERPLPLTHLTVSLIGRVDVHTSTRELGARARARAGWAAPHAAVAADDAGTLNICRDELVLCGEGRLEPGVYKFGFELEFCKLPGLGGGLPTSVDFEKGSISYTVSATLTRPNNLTPTRTSSAKIAMMDAIDIALYPLPKPRVIRLEPVSRHHSTKKTSPPHARSCSPTTACSSPSSSSGNLHDSPVAPPPEKAPITATVELLNAGALRGESIGVKISIQHTKRVKSLNGIILTLLRQTRLDPAGELDDVAFEKSKASTVGGVVALPVASTFRKDLAQTICPIIIDPDTLSAVVKASLRVPEDVFPTIANVPGGAVEFRYWVEVVMDLGGKLNGCEDLFSAVVPGFARPAGGVEADFSKAGGGDGGGGGGGVGGGRAGNGALSIEGGVMIETERVRRREKSVVSCKFEVIVGSVDSVGRKGRIAKPPPSPSPPPSAPRHTQQQQQAPDYDPAWHQPTLAPADAKARIRMAEDALLPSAPPPEAGPSTPMVRDLASAPLATMLATVLEDDAVDDEEEAVVDKAERERWRLLVHESAPPGEAGGSCSSAPSSAALRGFALEADGVDGGLPVYWR